MQKIIQYAQKDFWSSEPDLTKINENIAELNSGGWKIISLHSNVGISGRVASYTILIELIE